MTLDTLQNLIITLFAIAVVFINLRQDHRIERLEEDSAMQYENDKNLAEAINHLLEDAEMQNNITQSMLDEMNRLHSRIDDLYRVNTDGTD